MASSRTDDDRTASGTTAPSTDADVQWQLLRTAVDHLRDAVLITEAERQHPSGRRILYANRAFTRMTGYTVEETVGQTPDITVGPNTDREAIQRIREALDARRPLRQQILKYRKDGTQLWVELDLAPVHDDSGRCRYFVSVLRDITERHELRARLVEADRLAAVGTLAAGVAHEINNPLTHVFGNLQLAQRLLERGRFDAGSPGQEPSLPGLAELLGEALDGAVRVRQIVRDLRTFSSAESAEVVPVDVARALELAVKLVGNEVRQRATLRTAIGQLPPVLGNRARLGQVFTSLLVNAMQAIDLDDPEPNRVEVRARAAESYVHIEFEDTGQGIPAALRGRIFDPFVTTRFAEGGMGLGLALCHGIVTSMGGRIQVQSEVGRGSLFLVSLPAITETAADSPTTETAPSKGRILVVDDQPAVARAVAATLKRDHYNVMTAGGGQHAIDLIERDEGIDAVVCDLMMPDLDGRAVLGWIREHRPSLALRTVLMTGGAFTQAARDFLERAECPCVEKPIDFRALRVLVGDLVQRSLVERAERAAQGSGGAPIGG